MESITSQDIWKTAKSKCIDTRTIALTENEYPADLLVARENRIAFVVLTDLERYGRLIELNLDYEGESSWIISTDFDPGGSDGCTKRTVTNLGFTNDGDLVLVLECVQDNRFLQFLLRKKPGYPLKVEKVSSIIESDNVGRASALSLSGRFYACHQRIILRSDHQIENAGDTNISAQLETVKNQITMVDTAKRDKDHLHISLGEHDECFQIVWSQDDGQLLVSSMRCSGRNYDGRYITVYDASNCIIMRSVKLEDLLLGSDIDSRYLALSFTNQDSNIRIVRGGSLERMEKPRSSTLGRVKNGILSKLGQGKTSKTPKKLSEITAEHNFCASLSFEPPKLLLGIVGESMRNIYKGVPKFSADGTCFLATSDERHSWRAILVDSSTGETLVEFPVVEKGLFGGYCANWETKTFDTDGRRAYILAAQADESGPRAVDLKVWQPHNPGN